MGIDDVIVVDTAEASTSHPNLKKKKFKDYLTRETLLKNLEKGQHRDVNIIVHLGACTDTTERNKPFLQKNNFEYTQKLAEWALARTKIFHYASSASIYGDGTKGYSDRPSEFSKYRALNFYGESKRTFDEWVFKEKLEDRVVGFRFFNVFGPNEYHKEDMRSMVSKAFDQIKETGRVKLFATTREGHENGSEQRDFVYVKDVCEVMAYFLQNPSQGGIYNLGTGQARSFKDLATAVFQAMDKPVKIDYVPMPDSLKGQYQYFTEADLANLRKIGYHKKFMPLEDSVQDYVQNYLMKPDPYL